MADSPQNIMLVGAQIVCYVNSCMFGRVSSVNLSIDSPRRKIHVIDTLQPVELAPMSVDVSGSMTIFRLKKDNGIEGVGMMAQWANLTYEKYFDLALIDRATDSRLLNSGALMFHLEGCSVESQRWSITPKGYVIGTVAFSGLLYNNHMS